MPRRDPVRDRIAELDHACLDLADGVERLRTALGQVRTMRERGQRVSEILAFGPAAPARRQVRESWARLNRALHAYRVQAVKSMIDNEGMSIADAARVTGNARQVVSRLYHEA